MRAFLRTPSASFDSPRETNARPILERTAAVLGDRGAETIAVWRSGGIVSVRAEQRATHSVRVPEDHSAPRCSARAADQPPHLLLAAPKNLRTLSTFTFSVVPKHSGPCETLHNTEAGPPSPHAAGGDSEISRGLDYDSITLNEATDGTIFH